MTARVPWMAPDASETRSDGGNRKSESEGRLEVRKTLPYIRASGVERRPATQWPGRRAAEQAEARKRRTKAEIGCRRSEGSNSTRGMQSAAAKAAAPRGGAGAMDGDTTQMRQDVEFLLVEAASDRAARNEQAGSGEAQTQLQGGGRARERRQGERLVKRDNVCTLEEFSN